jgi:hypothetical protein
MGHHQLWNDLRDWMSIQTTRANRVIGQTQPNVSRAPVPGLITR